MVSARLFCFKFWAILFGFIVITFINFDIHFIYQLCTYLTKVVHEV
jgi:hypothetical protein